jgi:hypothetical protein
MKSRVSTRNMPEIPVRAAPKNPAFTNVVVAEGNVKTVHIGGQDVVSASGE